jgi:hypothetical protein
MMKNRVAALLAAPAAAAAILGGAALALAGTASADLDPSTGYSDFSGDFTTSSFFAHPTTYASPAPGIVPWGTWINQP